MAQIDDDVAGVGESPAQPVQNTPVRRGCLWSLLRLLSVLLMLIALGLPWTTDFQSLSGYVTIGLIGAFTLGLFCLPYLLVVALGVVLAVIDMLAPGATLARIRNVLSILNLIALAVAAILSFGVIVASSVGLDDSWGALVFGLVAMAAFALEIVARRSRPSA